MQLFIWSNALWYLINIFLNAVGCIPRAKLWNPMVSGYCFLTFDRIKQISALVNMLSDVFILLAPVFWACKLQMARKRKLGVSLVFASAIL